MIISEKVLTAVAAAAQEKKISCADAQKLAGELGVEFQVVGAAANQLDIKIHSCQLGCF